ncbi:2-oxoglutarate dehydrogenase E1 subunit family protein, partial [Cryobacterium shii]
MSSQLTGSGSDETRSGEFGANEWLVDELYERYLVDKNLVDESWWPVLESYHQTANGAAAATGAPAAGAETALTAAAAEAPSAAAPAAATPAAE